MANMSTIHGDVFYADDVVFGGSVAVPAGSFGNADIKAAAGLATSKLDHRYLLVVAHNQWSRPIPETIVLHIARAAGSIVAVEASAQVAGTHATLGCTVDVHKSTAEGAFATVLSATIGLDSAYAAREVVAATLDTSEVSLVDGDLVAVVITPTGTSATQPEGLTVVVTIDEDAQ